MKTIKFTIGPKSFKLDEGKLQILREIPIPMGNDYLPESRWVEANPHNCGGQAQYKLAQERAKACQIVR